jgi:hypothetical protein
MPAAVTVMFRFGGRSLHDPCSSVDDDEHEAEAPPTSATMVPSVRRMSLRMGAHEQRPCRCVFLRPCARETMAP